MKKCYNIKTWEDITDRTIINLTEDRIFVIHKDGCEEKIYSENYMFIKQQRLSTFQMLERMIEQDDAYCNYIIRQSIPFDPILTKLCEITGAKMYDDYIIIRDKKCRPINQDHETTFYDGDVFVYTQNTGLGFAEKTNNTLLFNTDSVFNEKIENGFISRLLENYRKNNDNYYNFFYPNNPNIAEEILKIRTDIEYAKNILDIRQRINMKKTEEKKFKKFIEESSDLTLKIKYFERIAPSGYNKYANVFEEYSKYVSGKDNVFEEIVKLLNNS